jgi:hypothetical protein
MSKFYIFFITSCLIACSDEVDIIINENGSNNIEFAVGIFNDISMRVATSDDFKTTFDDNNAIGLFIYKRNEGEDVSVDKNALHVNNIKLTNNGESWELETPIYYPGSKKLIDIYAYYPYKEDAIIDAMEYNAHEEIEELLMASAIGIKQTENAIMLKFKHSQSLVHITLTKDDNVPDFDDNMNVYFNGIIGGKYNIATQELIEPAKGIIKMDLAGEPGKTVRSYMAFIPEQEAGPGILFSIFQMTSNKEILSSKDIDHPEIFTRGWIKLFRIRIKQEISKDIVYNLYDLYPRYGTPVGMVIEVYNGGKNGKVISLKNIEDVQWAIPEAAAYVTGATDINDGITNKMKVQSLENWETNYPAFEACVKYGERWYLPGIGEMKWFFTNNWDNGNRLNKINERLRYHINDNPELNIEEVYTNKSYFSSTESSTVGEALKLYTGGDWGTPSEPKNWAYYIRPFYEF